MLLIYREKHSVYLVHVVFIVVDEISQNGNPIINTEGYYYI